jgi:hypothetical protein
MPPTVYQGQETGYTDAVVVIRQLEHHLEMTDPKAYPLLKAVGLNSYDTAIENTYFEWQRDSLIPNVDPLAEEVLIGDGVITVTNGEYFLVGDVVMVESELMRVSVVTGDVLTVEREFAGSTKAAHATALPVYRLGKALAEGSAPGVAQQTLTVQLGNYTQIWDATAEISGTEEAIKNYAPDDLMSYRIDKRMAELYMMMERSFLHGRAFEPQTNTGRTSGGLHYWITDVVDLNDAAIEFGDIDGTMQDIAERVGQENAPDTIWVNGFVRRVLSSWGTSPIRTGRTEDVYGNIVNVLDTNFGTIQIKLDNLIPPANAYLLNMSKLAIGPLKGRGFHTIDATTPGVDAKKERIIGEYGFVVKGEDRVNDGCQAIITEISQTLFANPVAP